jgi:hypothetical protein
LEFRFQFVRPANISRGSARDVPAAVDEGENAGEESQRGKHEDQDAVAKGLRSLRAGGGSVLVAHRAALGCRGRSEGRQQQRKAESYKYGGPNCEASLHLHTKSLNGATAVSPAIKAELQRLKPPNRAAFLSWLKPRPTKILESSHSLSARLKPCPDGTNLVRSQVHQPDAVREEHDQHHANAEYHGWDEEQKQAQAFEAQVHEVGHDQGRLD